MSGHVACLRGWHPALAKAEFSAMFPDNKIRDLASHRLISVSGKLSPDVALQGIECCSGTKAILLNSVQMSWDDSPGMKEKFLQEVSVMILKSNKTGSILLNLEV